MSGRDFRGDEVFVVKRRDLALFASMPLDLTRIFCALSAVMLFCSSSHADGEVTRLAHQKGMGNPIIPGYYADPSLVVHEGRYYLYATLDPWGDATLGCWESVDFINWTYRELNWPTKADCSSPTSKNAGVWAPSVIKARDGRFYMYVSVGNEVWAGVAEHPTGPWRNALGNKPMIPGDFRPGYHMIDAEIFIDDDGRPYLYWGSGWNWVNGKCWAVELAADMVTFVGEVRDVTPPRFFEAPFMVKREGRYHLMYSSGKTPEDTYQVHSAVGDTPFGPFTEESASPILITDRSQDVISPGHHAVFVREGRHYILYHRHSVPFDPKFIGRQICVDELNFDARGQVKKVVPTHTGPSWLPKKSVDLAGLQVSASSEESAVRSAGKVLDANNATWWRAAKQDQAPWLKLEFEPASRMRELVVIPEYAWRNYRLRVEVSVDGAQWTVQSDHMEEGRRGSPWRWPIDGQVRAVRLVFSPDEKQGPPAVVDCRLE